MSRPLIVSPQNPRNNIVSDPLGRFTIHGDLIAAYEYLSNNFGPKATQENKSGGLKPLNPQERLIQENPGISEMLKAPLHFE